jgi:hypothetical protein
MFFKISGSTQKSMRLNSVKRIARSANPPPKETEIHKDKDLPPEEIQSLDNQSFMATS